jgi:N-[(2S)-2-amino-2-carboxyethyl]-L-glutamate dehydrogenase
MDDRDVLVVGGDQVRELLAGREQEVLAAVRAAYLAHAHGQSSLPHSTFLQFPGHAANRIIALPALLAGDFNVAGVKWIASFPGNVDHGQARATAVLVLNSCANGRPEAILEGSLISAARTAASAALAAESLLAGRAPGLTGMIGAGLINAEIARYLRVTLPGATGFLLHDLEPARAARAAAAWRRALPGIETEVARGIDEVLRRCELVSFATTAARPHVGDLAHCPPGTAILHISLRDLTPQAILASDNVTDDPDHACRAQTSLHLAEQLTGSRHFIRCTLGDILQGTAPARAGDGRVAVFSPFGLGILDLAVGQLVSRLAQACGRTQVIRSFLPATLDT